MSENSSGTTSRRGTYRKSTKTRQRILDAALEVFGGAGFDGASLREVAGRAKISEAGLLHHFPSKASLLQAVVARRDEEAEGRTDEHQSGIARLAALVDYARDSTQKPHEIELFAVLSAEATRPDHPAHTYMRERYHNVRELLGNAFTAAQDEGHLRDGVTPTRATSHFIALWDGLQLQWLLHGRSIDIAAELECALDDWLMSPLATLAASPRVAAQQ